MGRRAPKKGVSQNDVMQPVGVPGGATDGLPHVCNQSSPVLRGTQSDWSGLSPMSALCHPPPTAGRMPPARDTKSLQDNNLQAGSLVTSIRRPGPGYPIAPPSRANPFDHKALGMDTLYPVGTG